MTSSEGYRHEALLYRSDDQFLASVLPFLVDGVDAGEVSLVSLGPAGTRLLRDSGVDTSAMHFVEDSSRHDRPAAVIRAYRELFSQMFAQGASRVRVLSEVPHSGLGVPWDEWSRYEATINHAYAPYPVWGLCPYDVRVTPAAVLDDVLRTHPTMRGEDGASLPNEHYIAPEQFLTERSTPRRELPPETSPPAVDLTDPTPAAARRVVREASLHTMLPEEEVDDLVTAVSEAVTNALTHGVGPARLRLWPERHRLVATISDRGQGPTDPYAGLLPTTDSATGGLGLWIIHQVCAQVTLDRGPDGFTLRLVAGAPGGEHA